MGEYIVDDFVVVSPPTSVKVATPTSVKVATPTNVKVATRLAKKAAKIAKKKGKIQKLLIEINDKLQTAESTGDFNEIKEELENAKNLVNNIVKHNSFKSDTLKLEKFKRTALGVKKSRRKKAKK
jgi:DNA-binding transcriptional regulator GbsR (MarR family)